MIDIADTTPPEGYVLVLRKDLHNAVTVLDALDPFLDPNTERWLIRLREIVSHTPAKPTEPQNIGAAVEDINGQVWVRVMWGLRDDIAWRDTKPPTDRHNYRRYKDIDVIKVLHEGWK